MSELVKRAIQNIKQGGGKIYRRGPGNYWTGPLTPTPNKDDKPEWWLSSTMVRLLEKRGVIHRLNYDHEWKYDTFALTDSPQFKPLRKSTNKNNS